MPSNRLQQPCNQSNAMHFPHTASLSNHIHRVEWSSILSLLTFCKNRPKSQRFISSSSYDGLSIRTHSQIQYTTRMSRQRSNLCHRWILPNRNLILTIPVRTHELRRILGPRQITYLTSGVDFIDTISIHGIPKANFAICCAASGS